MRSQFKAIMSLVTKALGTDAHYVNINSYIDSNNDQFQVGDLFEESYNDERVLLTTSHQLVRRRGAHQVC